MLTTRPDPFVDVTEAKKHLNMRQDISDAELSGFIDAACEMIRTRVGEVLAVPATETVTVSGGRAVLRHRPVLAVDTPGWVLLSPEGVASAPTGDGRAEVSYTAGRAATASGVPGHIRLAGLELVRHLWTNSQNRGAGSTTRPVAGASDSSYMPGTAYSMPYRVRELLGLGAEPTDQPLVG
ncbi:head-tail connector protein [Nocardiopsis alba]|uniref:head-tail connector protein n=1 Tax=Nocardiopsis alba TaxID=53437 RepID=UPI0036865772